MLPEYVEDSYLMRKRRSELASDVLKFYPLGAFGEETKTCKYFSVESKHLKPENASEQD